MPFDAFLKIDPGDTGVTVAGESLDSKHKGEIEILNFSWGASNPISIGSATGGAGAGKLKFKPFIVTKKIDLSSAGLFRACAIGAHFPTATLTIRKAGGTQLEYLVLTFKTVFVTSIQPFGQQLNTSQSLLAPVDPSQGSNPLPTEQITFVYGALGVQYQQQGSDGKPQGGPVIAGWSQLTNSKT